MLQTATLTENGVPYIIASLQFLPESVINGLWYSSRVIADSVPRWSNIPLVHNHPFNRTRGMDIIGSVRYPSFKSGWIQAYGYFSIPALQMICPHLITQLRSQRLALSPGIHQDMNGAAKLGKMFPDLIPAQAYKGVAYALSPHHLAVLTPPRKPAVSIAQGCGVNVVPFDVNDFNMRRSITLPPLTLSH